MADEYPLINVELDEEAEQNLAILMEEWAKRNLSAPSFMVFAEKAEEIGICLPDLEQALGHAITNEIILETMTEHMETESETTE